MVPMGAGIGIESRLKLPERFRYERVVKEKLCQAGEKWVFAGLEGPGCVRHLYCAVSRGGNYIGTFNSNRSLILRVYWDDEQSPSVEVPVADFFGIHHNVSYYPINSCYVSAKADAGLGCYFPMPFAKTARFEVEAQQDAWFIYTLDWHRYLDCDFAERLRFHASWRRENPAPAWAEDFFVMDAVGKGYLAGFSLGVRLRSDEQRWTHAGSENLYIDGEASGQDGIDPHYLRAGGGENSFDVGFGGVAHTPESYLYSGFPFCHYADSGLPLARHLVSAYRFYVHDLLPFEKSLHFRWGSQKNDMCATAYWYQDEPHRTFVKKPSAEDLQYGDWNREIEVPRGKYDLLRQIGATGPDAVSADRHDGTWSLLQGVEALLQADRRNPGVVYHAFHGFVDFSHVFNVRSRESNVTWPCDATARTHLTVARDTPATLHLSWDGDLKLRLNEGGVQGLPEHTHYCGQRVPLNLHKGQNVLWLHLNNASDRYTWGSFTFSCRVTLPDGSVLIPQAAPLPSAMAR